MIRRKELLRQLTEKQERMDLLAQRLDVMEGIVAGYRSREQSIVDALANAQDHAKRSIRDAQQRAEEIVTDADSQASKLVRTAEEKSRRMLKDSEDAVTEYERLMNQYNQLLEDNAREAAASAEKYAAMLRGRAIGGENYMQDVAALRSKPFSDAKDLELPDASEDPAVLMHNIYRLQNRDIPEMDQSEPAAEESRQDRLGVQLSAQGEEHVAGDTDGGGETPPAGSEQGRVPAQEREEEQVPTVRQYVKTDAFAQQDEEISLDDLLDEIIQAGEGNE